VLAMPISLAMPILPGPSGMLDIIMPDLAMLSPVHFIIAAEAGVKASAENIAAVIRIVFIKSSLGTKTNMLLVFEIRILHQRCFREKIIFLAAMQRFHAGAPANVLSDEPGVSRLVIGGLMFRRLTDAARRGVRIARGLAMFGGLTPVDAAGEPIDQPDAVFGGAVHADKAGTDNADQRRQ
jgi:hypothetical protein